MQQPYFYNQREFIRDHLPACLKSKRLSRKQQAFAQARKVLEDEVNII